MQPRRREPLSDMSGASEPFTSAYDSNLEGLIRTRPIASHSVTDASRARESLRELQKHPLSPQPFLPQAILWQQFAFAVVRQLTYGVGTTR
jgi:hypothetical protein